MSKLIEMRDAIKKASKTILQLAICGTISAFIIGFDMGIYAFAGLGSLVLMLALAVIIANVVWDDEMRVRFMRRDGKGKIQFYV